MDLGAEQNVTGVQIPFILCEENSIFPVLAVLCRITKPAVQQDTAGFVFYHIVNVVKFIS